jgi:hypothetical protein
MTVKKARVTSKFIPEDKEVFAEHNVYDSVSEATGSMGEKDLLELINAQVRTNAMNTVRAQYNTAPSKEALRRKARASITLDEFREVVGDEAKLEALIDKKVAALEALSPGGNDSD